MTKPDTPPEVREVEKHATAATEHATKAASAQQARDDAIVTAHANHDIPMADIYAAARLSPGMVHRILTRAGAPHRPRGGRPAAADGGALWATAAATRRSATQPGTPSAWRPR